VPIDDVQSQRAAMASSEWSASAGWMGRKQQRINDWLVDDGRWRRDRET
jgi:hypothetical protein